MVKPGFTVQQLIYFVSHHTTLEKSPRFFLSLQEKKEKLRLVVQWNTQIYPATFFTKKFPLFFCYSVKKLWNTVWANHCQVEARKSLFFLYMTDNGKVDVEGWKFWLAQSSFLYKNLKFREEIRMERGHTSFYRHEQWNHLLSRQTSWYKQLFSSEEK